MTYFDTCKAVASGVDNEALSNLELGKILGVGSESLFRQLGELDIGAGEMCFAGLKLQRKEAVSDTETRISGEVAVANLIGNLAPGLLDKMPKFMCYLRVDGGVKGVILTEDASMGGQKRVRSMRTSQETRRQLYAPLSAYGPIEKVLDVETLDIATASNVDGKERLLDFTPPPIGSILYINGDEDGLLTPHLEKVYEELDSITVTIGSDTPLGKALVNL